MHFTAFKYHWKSFLQSTAHHISQWHRLSKLCYVPSVSDLRSRTEMPIAVVRKFIKYNVKVKLDRKELLNLGDE